MALVCDGGGVFIVAGFAMAMTLPSNLFFVGGLAVFTVLTKHLESKESTFPIKNIIWTGIPALITFVLIGIYFLVIYEGLKYGKEYPSLAYRWRKDRKNYSLPRCPVGILDVFIFCLWFLEVEKEKRE